MRMDRESFLNGLARVLQSENYCLSPDEAHCVAEAIVEDTGESASELSSIPSNPEFRKALAVRVSDYFSLPREEGLKLVETALKGSESNFCESNGEHIDDSIESDVQLVPDEDSDGEVIQEGECELCERYIQLTKHHLIPKCTWPRVKTKLQHAVEALATGDKHRASVIMGPGLAHLLPCLSESEDPKTFIRQALQRTCEICRPCHSAIHRTHDNMTLACDHNTVEKLLDDESICKFVKWASKQKTGKYARNP